MLKSKVILMKLIIEVIFGVSVMLLSGIMIVDAKTYEVLFLLPPLESIVLCIGGIAVVIASVLYYLPKLNEVDLFEK